MPNGWIAVDFDGTLATYDGNFTITGQPIPRMVNRVKEMLRKGFDVRIFTARVSHQDQEKRLAVEEAIAQWCETHIGQRLPITNVKDFHCIAIYDDKAYTVEKNTGRILTRKGWM